MMMTPSCIHYMYISLMYIYYMYISLMYIHYMYISLMYIHYMYMYISLMCTYFHLCSCITVCLGFDSVC